MRIDRRDMARLWDMLQAARDALSFVGGRQYEDLLTNSMLRNALERSLEIVGEAARCLSQGFRDQHPDIPWRGIIGLRNVLAHEYDEIRYDRLWIVCAERLPQLVQWLEGLGIEDMPEDRL